MKKNDNFDFIQSKFNEDNIKTPYAVDEEILTQLIDGSEQKRLKLYQKKSFKAVTGLVACFVLIAVVAVTLNRAINAPVFIDTDKISYPDNSISADVDEVDGLSTFSSYDELTKKLKRMNASYYTDISLYKYNSKGGVDEALVTEVAADGVSTSTASGSYAQTYKQEDNVDEADIIKNNGKYIFWVDKSSEIIRIYEGKKLVSSIKDFSVDNDDSYKNIYEMYLYGDKLVVNCFLDESVQEKTDKQTYEYFVSSTASYIYDISDAKNPKELYCFKQSGYFLDSRMVGNTLYLISNYNSFQERKIAPYICDDKKGETYVSCDSIYYPEKPESTNFLVISAIDVDKCKQTTKTKAFLGFAEKIYCTDHSLYIIASGEKTEIIKAELKDGKVKFTSTGKVKGYVNDQFSMSEKDGYFRIATTYYDEKDNKEKNYLFILDEKLNKVGELSGFAKNESIKAVKYIGDMAYVITYKQIDPLFVIDLSDPKNPEIKGSVEITGFSSLLVPVDENTLLGVGYATETDDEREYTDGLKLALFDISNPEKPEVLDSYVMKDAYSEAQYNHHALVINKDMNYFAVAYENDFYSGENSSKHLRGALLIRVENGKLIVNKDAASIKVNDFYSYAPRCTFIGDKLYLLENGKKEIEEYTITESMFK